MLAALHRANPAAIRLPRCEIGLPGRADLDGLAAPSSAKTTVRITAA
jgi:hypothetical protein